eukprot:COSAG02_NODE_2063_length_9965_cov_116.411920_10_plen_209_part_00
MSLCSGFERSVSENSTISPGLHHRLVTELCVLRTFGGVDFSLIFICAQSVPEFLWDRLRASIQFPVMPKRAQYARFSGEGVLRRVVAWRGRYILPAEQCALHMLRQQSNFLSAPQSVPSNLLETDWGAIFQWKVTTRNMCNAQGNPDIPCIVLKMREILKMTEEFSAVFPPGCLPVCSTLQQVHSLPRPFFDRFFTGELPHAAWFARW